MPILKIQLCVDKISKPLLWHAVHMKPGSSIAFMINGDGLMYCVSRINCNGNYYAIARSFQKNQMSKVRIEATSSYAEECVNDVDRDVLSHCHIC